MKRTSVILGGLAAAVVLSASAPAAAWDPFRSENGDVREGNEAMAAGDAVGALAAYERAARALPREPGVHLDRGLALLATGRLDEAREALRIATEPPAPAEIRAAAHYDLGLAFYQQGEAAAQAEQHEEAQRLFREAADAFRSSLRQVPGNRDAGWNLELALRRIREQQEQQEQQDQQQEQQDQQQEQQDQQQEQQDQQQEQEQQPGESQEARDEESERADETESSGTEERSLPPDMERVLDALQDGEESLERSMARSRGQRSQRRVEQDW